MADEVVGGQRLLEAGEADLVEGVELGDVVGVVEAERAVGVGLQRDAGARRGPAARPAARRRAPGRSSRGGARRPAASAASASASERRRRRSWSPSAAPAATAVRGGAEPGGQRPAGGLQLGVEHRQLERGPGGVVASDRAEVRAEGQRRRRSGPVQASGTRWSTQHEPLPGGVLRGVGRGRLDGHLGPALRLAGPHVDEEHLARSAGCRGAVRSGRGERHRHRDELDRLDGRPAATARARSPSSHGTDRGSVAWPGDRRPRPTGASRPTTPAGAAAAGSSSAATRRPTDRIRPGRLSPTAPGARPRSPGRPTPTRARPSATPESPVQSRRRDRADARRRPGRRRGAGRDGRRHRARASPPTSSTPSATQACIDRGGYPSPLNYNGFPKSLCTSVNEVICHGIPDDRALVDGDIVNLDVTIFLDGVHGDTNATFLVGDVDDESRRLVRGHPRVPRARHRRGAPGPAVLRHRPGHPDPRRGRRLRRGAGLRRPRHRRAVPHRPAVPHYYEPRLHRP